KYRSEVGKILTLSDTPQKSGSAAPDGAQRLATTVVEAIKQNIFPIIGV
ncbi:MAG: hypothetical protein JRF27_03975, partial [Deltaproteobacteria bacterium]|nr:hypothetical protein [Deltaproteobacteria bacterium]